MINKDVVGKYIIVENLEFKDFMKDDDGKIITYDSLDQAAVTCGMYEWDDVIVLKVEYNHIENKEPHYNPIKDKKDE